MEALLATLLHWLAVNTQFDTNIPHPTVIELSPEALTKEYYSDSLSAIPANGVDHRIQALYSWNDGPSGTIYILSHEYTDTSPHQETGLNNPYFQEQLLHELIHHAQYHSGEYASFECKNQGELQAYRLGGKFLKQQHVSDPLPNRRVLSYIYSRC